MYRFALKKKFLHLDLNNPNDRIKYASLCECGGVEIINEKDIIIQPQQGVADKMGGIIFDPVPPQFIKDIIYIIRERSLVPDEFK